MLVEMEKKYSVSSWLIIPSILDALLVAFLSKGYQERRRAIQLKKQNFVSYFRLEEILFLSLI